ncbi:hypothetical protein [Streptomyces sp. NPDC046862]
MPFLLPFMPIRHSEFLTSCLIGMTLRGIGIGVTSRGPQCSAEEEP